MAEHSIEIDLPPNVVLNRDVVFKVKSGNRKLGELRLSRGTIDWVPGNHQTAFRLKWERFDELMRDYGRRRRLTK